jgi:hypothetical protein
MDTLNLSAYNLKKELVFNKAKEEAECYIAQAPPPGHAMVVKYRVARSYYDAAKCVNQEVIDMMSSSGFFIRFHYRPRDMMVHIEAVYRRKTPEEMVVAHQIIN